MKDCVRLVLDVAVETFDPVGGAFFVDGAYVERQIAAFAAFDDQALSTIKLALGDHSFVFEDVAPPPAPNREIECRCDLFDPLAKLAGIALVGIPRRIARATATKVR
jgi:hypothetical protein